MIPVMRSMLYLPADKMRVLEKAQGLGADALIFDLEDAVAPAAKHAAREALGEALARFDYGKRLLLIRMNALDTEWGADDLAALAPIAAQLGAGILLPKVNRAEDLAQLADHLSAGPQAALPLWAMMETAEGILNAASIARAPRLAGFVMGTNDLAKELGLRPHPERLPLITALGTAVLAAKAARIAIVDGVYNAFKDPEGLAREAAQGRDLGFDGKTIIHPAQIDGANAAFSPSEEEVDRARRQIAAYEAVLAEGGGVAVVDGQIVENLHVETAQKTLAIHARICQD